MFENLSYCQMWWHMPKIPALRRQMQKDGEFKDDPVSGISGTH